MSQTHASVRTEHLEEALDYLEGLALILREFHSGADGHDPRAQLLIALQSMDSHGSSWEPLRYQPGVGQGWQYVAESVEHLRTRLLEGYADAAL